MPPKLSNQDYQIRLKRGTASKLTSNEDTYGLQGEPFYATDTRELYIHDGTEYVPLITNATPSSASDTGVKGQIAWDNNYIYICSATDTWLRVAIATW